MPDTKFHAHTKLRSHADFIPTIQKIKNGYIRKKPR
jgi:hypothetical protein